MKSLLISIAALAFVLGTAACNSNPNVAKFTQVDISKAQEQITNDFQNKGFEVEQVNLVKDSDRHLTGYVKIRKASGLIRPQLVRNCAATMDEDSGKYILECKP
jgi:hypothetical protein